MQYRSALIGSDIGMQGKRFTFKDEPVKGEELDNHQKTIVRVFSYFSYGAPVIVSAPTATHSRTENRT